MNMEKQFCMTDFIMFLLLIMETDKEIISILLKSYYSHLVTQTNLYPFLFNYCDFDGGRLMQ